MRYVQLVKGAAKDFGQDDAMAHAAAVAFYTALSFAPLVLLVITIGGFLGEETQNDLVRFFQRQMGTRASEITEVVVEQSAAEQQAGRGTWRWVVSVGMLMFSASLVFAQLQTSLNRIWDVRAKPGKGVMQFVRKRLLGVGMIFAILFIMLVALIVSSIIQRVLPTGAGPVGQTVELVVSLLVFAVLFAAIYKFLPDVHIEWRDVWVGAAVTAVLFAAGKLAISLYLQHGRVGESYGNAAASLIALLVWVYYSAVILFFGAEVTQQYARMRGATIEPNRFAERLGHRA